MLRNAPHRAEHHRRVQTINGGIVSWTDQTLGTVSGWFSLGSTEGATPGALTGAGQASFYCNETGAVEGDLLTVTAPAAGTWKVTSVRPSPMATRLVLDRV